MSLTICLQGFLPGPWNIAFWFAVLGETSAAGNFVMALALSLSVVAGAASWSLALSASGSLGKNWIRPSWQVHASLVTALLMLAFAAQKVPTSF